MSESGVAVEIHTGKTCRHCNEPITGSALAVFRYRGTPAAVEILHFHKPCIESLLWKPLGMMERLVPSKKGQCPECGKNGGDITFKNRAYKYGNYHTECIKKIVDLGDWTTDPKYEEFVDALRSGSFDRIKKYFKEKKVGYIDKITNQLSPEEIDIYCKANSAAKKRVEESIVEGKGENLDKYIRLTWSEQKEDLKLKFLRRNRDSAFYEEVKRDLFQPVSEEKLQNLLNLAEYFKETDPMYLCMLKDFWELFEEGLVKKVVRVELLMKPNIFYTQYGTEFLGAKHFPLVEESLHLINEDVLVLLTNSRCHGLLPPHVKDRLDEALLLVKEGERILGKSF